MRNLFFLLAIIFFSCNEERQFSAEIDKDIELYKVKVRTELFAPQTIHLMGEFLVIQDRKQDEYFLSILDTIEFKELKRFGRQGKGPKEIGIVGFVNKLNSDSLIVYDLTDKEAFLFSIQNLIQGDEAPISTFHLKDDKGPSLCNSLIYSRKNNCFIGSGVHFEGRYAKYQMDGNCVKYFINYPELGFETENPLSEAVAFQSTLCQNKDGVLFASSSKGVVDLLKVEDTEIVLLERLLLYNSEMKNMGNIEIEGENIPNIATSSQSIVGIDNFHFQCSENSIYFLFSKIPINEFITNHKPPSYTEIYSISWNGDIKYRYKLDKDVKGFAGSFDKNYAYFLGLDDNLEPTLFKGYL